MSCADIDILLCDYVDGTLDTAQKAVVEEHLAQCAACAELAGDAGAAVKFMDRCAEVEPPKELLTRLVFAAAPAAKQSRGIRVRFARFLEPILQPRFAMGMAMTILSFSLLGRFVPIRQLQPKDLNPVEIWASLDDKVHRTWERGVKYYESMRLFVELKSRFQELTAQDEDQRKAQSAPAQQSGAVNEGALVPAKPGEQKKR
jgi:hypothetical protein